MTVQDGGSAPPWGAGRLQYLLGAGGSVSAGGGHAAGPLDELWPMLLSMGAILKMDSNMQDGDDDSRLQRFDWLPESDMNQSKAE